MRWFLLAGLIGLLAGSFIALAADRYRPAFTGQQWLHAIIVRASRCSACAHWLRPKDLAPLYSCCWLCGRCCYCRGRLPCHLLLTEPAAGLLFSLIATVQPSPVPLAFSLFFSGALLLLSLIDYQHLLLPDAVTLPLLWLGLLYHLIFEHGGLAAAVIGAVSGWLALWLLNRGALAFCQQEGIGYGDMKLFAALGAWCGWQALPLIALIAASIGLAAFAYQLRREDAAGWQRRQPFGPCLSVAGWAVFFWQTQSGALLFFPDLRLQVVLDAHFLNQVQFGFQPVDMFLFICQNFNHHIPAYVIIDFIGPGNRLA